MNRPKYESKDDLDRERSFARRYAAQTGLVLHKLNPVYRADFAVTHSDKPGVLCWIEYKRRAMTWGQYHDVMLSFSKAASLMQLAERSGKRALFVVEDVSGEFRQADMSEVVRPVEIGGRTAKTRDKYDIEPIVRIPNSDFKEVTKTADVPF